ncbi:MAG: hypothetical protein RBU37_08285 [Myxococcota bacterium]|jgi:hypothetical protein|nr:hypothetical protein [Myxococcota bacterium]
MPNRTLAEIPEQVLAAARELGAEQSPLKQLLASFEGKAWVPIRQALSALRDFGPTAIGSAPTVLRLLCQRWNEQLDDYAQFGLNEAAQLLQEQLEALTKASASGVSGAAAILDYLQADGASLLVQLLAPPLRIPHRSLLSLLGRIRPVPQGLADAISVLMQAPIPEEQQVWHQLTHAQLLSAFISIGQAPPPLEIPPPPSVDSTEPEGEPERIPLDLDALLTLELRSNDPQRLRVALQALFGLPSVETFGPLLYELLSNPEWPGDLTLRSLCIQRLASLEYETESHPQQLEEQPSASSSTATAAFERLLQLATSEPDTSLRRAALSALTTLAARSGGAEALLECAENALQSREPAIQRAGIRLLTQLAAQHGR